jgi:adenylosuccinate synthase
MITIVVGAQYGGEGKGKIAAYLALNEKPECAIRCGGPNSSHTVVWKGKTVRLRMMPTAAVINPKIEVCFGAGALIHITTLLQECQQIGFLGDLRIDPQAGIVTEEVIKEQRQDPRYAAIGSTMTGTGYASAKRCLRSLMVARECTDLSNYLADVSILIGEKLSKNKRILVEGHQGFGLSNYHGDYPYTSSRDSTSSSMLAEIGIGPIQKDMKVVLVAKMFPTRNHAGKLEEELTPAQVNALEIFEFGGGSWGIKDRRRRVGLLAFEIIKRAVGANSATEIAITGVDNFLRAFSKSKDGIAHFIQTTKDLERTTGAPVRYLSWGPDTTSTLDLRNTADVARIRELKTDPGAVIDEYVRHASEH